MQMTDVCVENYKKQ